MAGEPLLELGGTILGDKDGLGCGDGQVDPQPIVEPNDDALDRLLGKDELPVHPEEERRIQLENQCVEGFT